MNIIRYAITGQDCFFFSSEDISKISAQPEEKKIKLQHDIAYSTIALMDTSINAIGFEIESYEIESEIDMVRDSFIRLITSLQHRDLVSSRLDLDSFQNCSELSASSSIDSHRTSMALFLDCQADIYNAVLSRHNSEPKKTSKKTAHDNIKKAANLITKISSSYASLHTVGVEPFMTALDLMEQELGSIKALHNPSLINFFQEEDIIKSIRCLAGQDGIKTSLTSNKYKHKIIELLYSTHKKIQILSCMAQKNNISDDGQKEVTALLTMVNDLRIKNQGNGLTKNDLTTYYVKYNKVLAALNHSGCQLLIALPSITVLENLLTREKDSYLHGRPKCTSYSTSLPNIDASVQPHVLTSPLNEPLDVGLKTGLSVDDSWLPDDAVIESLLNESQDVGLTAHQSVSAPVGDKNFSLRVEAPGFMNVSLDFSQEGGGGSGPAHRSLVGRRTTSQDFLDSTPKRANHGLSTGDGAWAKFFRPATRSYYGSVADDNFIDDLTATTSEQMGRQ